MRVARPFGEIAQVLWTGLAQEPAAPSLEEAARCWRCKTADRSIKRGQLPRLKLGRCALVVSRMVIANAFCSSCGHLSVWSTDLRL
jgi:hypothetical protein